MLKPPPYALPRRTSGRRRPGMLRFGVLLGALLSLAACTNGRSAGPDPARTASAGGEAPRFRAVTLDARGEPPPGALARLRDLGATHLAVIPFGFQPRYDVPEIRHNPDARWFSESDRGIHDLAHRAQALGMGLIIKPQLWLGGVQNESYGWSADIEMGSEADWQAWETNYRRLLLHYARLAEDVGAALLVIGTELSKAVAARPGFWRRLIADVRSVYGGALTYAGNWHDDYEVVAFWDALDYIGVQAYFPLSRADGPPLEALKRGWVPHRKALERLSQRVDRPLLFTELGYRSVPYAAAEPWRWPSREEAGRVDPDEALQARLYQAFFETFWGEPWFAGAILWKWQPEPPRSERRALGFTPQGKAAEAVIARWFSEE